MSRYVKLTSILHVLPSYQTKKSLKLRDRLPILPEEDRLEPRRMCIAVGSLSVVTMGVRNHSDLVRIRAACLS